MPLAKPGGFHRLAGFHIGPFSLEVPAVNPSVTPVACQLPLTREPCGQCPLTGVPPVSISHGSFLRIVLSLTRPVSLLRCSRCLGQSPPCQRGVPRHRRGGGIPQAGRFPHGFVLSESACCKSLSQKSKIFASSLSQGSLAGSARGQFRMGIFSKSLLPLQRPVTLPG